MKYIITDMGPLDRHPPGTDVTALYDAATLARLVEEGYVVDADAPKPKAATKKKVTK